MPKQMNNLPFLLSDDGKKIVGFKNADGTDGLGVINQVRSIYEIPNNQGVYQVGANIYTVDDAGKVTNVIDTIKPIDYSNLTPTHFFDPSATNSTGAGTYANPFSTQTQLAAWVTSLSGAMAGKMLGFKRGSVIKEPIKLLDVYGNKATNDPFIIVPYGDNEQRPVIDLTIPSVDWKIYPGDSRLLYKPDPYVQSYYQVINSGDVRENVMYYTRSSLANLQAAGPGYFYNDGTNTYLYPLYPNGSGIVQTNEAVTPANVGLNSSSAFTVTYANVAASGLIHVHGISALGGRNKSFEIRESFGGSGAITSVSDIIVDDIVAGMSGIESNVTAYMNAITVYGVSTTVPLTGSLISNCESFAALNNGIEVGHIDGAKLLYNRCRNTVWGKMYEGYRNTRNCVFAYSIHDGAGDQTRRPETAQGSAINGVDWNTSIWIPGYGNTGTSGVPAQSQGNVFAFNRCSNVVGVPVKLNCGGLSLYNNFIERYAVATFGNAIDVGVSGAATLSLSNNVIEVNNNSPAATTTGIINSSNAGDTVAGNNNIFKLAYSRSDDGFRFYYRGTNYTFPNWVAAVGSQANSLLVKTTGFTSEGRPISSVSALNGATMPTDFFADLDGKPFRSKFIGPYQQSNNLF